MEKLIGQIDNPKERLLMAGIDRFGQKDFEAVSTRELAKLARVNIAAIPYYFNSKKGLYHEVIRHITAWGKTQMTELLTDVQANIQDPAASLEVLSKACCHLLSALVTTISRGEARPFGRIIVREQMQPTEAFDILYEGLISHMHRTIGTIVSKVSGQPADHPLTVIRAQALVGQALVFMAARATIEKRLKHDCQSEMDYSQINQVISEHTNAILGQLSSKRDKGETQ